MRKAYLAVAVSAVAVLVTLTSVVARAQGAAPAAAAEKADPAQPAEKLAAALPPEKVVVGVYVNQVHEFSLKDNSFTVDFYVWFRWKNPELKPYETYSVVDGRIESKTDAVLKDLPGGEKYAYQRVVAKITRFFDTAAYPLDNHALTVIVEEEDSENHLVIYEADAQNSAASPAIKLSGWKFHRLNTVADVQSYRSNFGDSSLPTGNETKYARITTAVSFTREGWTFFFKLFFGLWITVLIASLVYFIKPTDVDPRFGLGVGALFAAIGSQYVVASSLPDSNVITLADQLHLIAFFFIFVSVAQSTVSLWMFQNEKEEASKKFDRLMRLIGPIAYVIANIWATVTTS